MVDDRHGLKRAHLPRYLVGRTEQIPSPPTTRPSCSRNDVAARDGTVGGHAFVPDHNLSQKFARIETDRRLSAAATLPSHGFSRHERPDGDRDRSPRGECAPDVYPLAQGPLHGALVGRRSPGRLRSRLSSQGEPGAA